MSLLRGPHPQKDGKRRTDTRETTPKRKRPKSKTQTTNPQTRKTRVPGHEQCFRIVPSSLVPVATKVDVLQNSQPVRNARIPDVQTCL